MLGPIKWCTHWRLSLRAEFHQGRGRTRDTVFISTKHGRDAAAPEPATVQGFLIQQVASWCGRQLLDQPTLATEFLEAQPMSIFFPHPSKHPVSYLYSLTNVFLFKETEESSLRRFHYLQPRILTPAGRRCSKWCKDLNGEVCLLRKQVSGPWDRGRAIREGGGSTSIWRLLLAPFSKVLQEKCDSG